MWRVCIALGVSLCCTPAHALEFSAEWALASEWVDRGISQTAGKPALQGGLGLAVETGPYLALWGSNVDFGDCCGESVQADMTLGMARQQGGMHWDAGITRSRFPGSDEDLDFTEYHLELGWRQFGLGASWTPDFASLGRELWYYELNCEFDLPWQGLRLQLHAGYTRGSALHRRFVDETGLEPYGDWQIALARDFGPATATLGWADTDMGGEFRVRDPAEFNDGTLFLRISGSWSARASGL